MSNARIVPSWEVVVGEPGGSEWGSAKVSAPGGGWVAVEIYRSDQGHRTLTVALVPEQARLMADALRQLADMAEAE